VREIMTNLKALGYQPVKNHGSPFAQRGRPDIEVVVACPPLPFGVHLAIEVKRSGEDVRIQQAARLEQLQVRGSAIALVSSWEGVKYTLEWIQSRMNRFIVEVRQ
jgi:hypothetical protein